MRAIQVVRNAEPTEAIEVADVETPAPGPGQVLVEVSAASLNFGDIARCRGGVSAVPIEPPFVLGMDVAGDVVSAGEGAEEWIGRRVVGITPTALGGQAEYAVAGTYFEAPPMLDDVQAAAFTLPFHLAALSFWQRARLSDGEVVMVRGGASGVGTAAIQVAKASGATVLAVAGGNAKTELCRSLGADVVIDHEQEDIFEAVMDATGGQGADVIFDPVGGELTETMWTCGALGARYVAAGFNDDPESGMTGRPLRRLSMSNVTVVGVILAYGEAPQAFRQFGFHPFPTAVGEAMHDRLLAMLEQHRLRPHVGRIVDFDGVADALEDHAARRTMGRTVLSLGRATR